MIQVQSQWENQIHDGSWRLKPTNQYGWTVRNNNPSVLNERQDCVRGGRILSTEPSGHGPRPRGHRAKHVWSDSLSLPLSISICLSVYPSISLRELAASDSFHTAAFPLFDWWFDFRLKIQKLLSQTDAKRFLSSSQIFFLIKYSPDFLYLDKKSRQFTWIVNPNFDSGGILRYHCICWIDLVFNKTNLFL